MATRLFREGETYTTSAGTLISAMRWARENLAGLFETGIWTQPTWTVEDLRRWFRKCLNQKINRHAPAAGRKHTRDYQSDLRHDARVIADYTQRRARSSGSRNMLRTKEMKRRFPHIDNQPSDPDERYYY